MTQSVRRWLALSIALLWSVGLHAQVRLLEDADVVETPAHYDLTLRFGCEVRYLTHAPVAEGQELRVRLALAASCPQAAGAAESLLTPAPAVVRSIELSALLAGEVEILIRWRVPQKYVVVPSNDRQGLRIRILRAGESGPEQSRVLVDEHSTDVATAYAINLESATTPFAAEAVEQAHAAFNLRSYVSETDVGPTHWYRLRLGPIATHADAERLLLLAQRTYPRAWLAIADEPIDTADLDAEQLVIADADSDHRDSRITDADADALWASANERFRQKDYAAAIAQFTKLITRSSGKYAAAAQELLGIAHERRAELALAQADYEAFLRRYPQDRRASRVRRRLYALRTASLPGRSANGGDANEEGVWHWNGGVSQYYRRDRNQLTVDTSTQSSVGQNALLNDIDLTARHRGLGVDTRIRMSAGYNKSFLTAQGASFTAGSADQAHVNSAFVEWADRDRQWYASVGRQTRSGSGSYGTFDGALASYQWHPHFTTDFTVGMPTDSAHSGVNSQRRFESLALNFGTFAGAWEPSVYVSHQTLEGHIDRQAVGAEVRYFRPGRVVIGFVDYDLYYHALNSAVLVGTVQLPARWSLSVDAEQRKSPLLTTRNALIGQPVSTLEELASAFSDEQIKQLALARTPDTRLFSLTATRPVGERLQFTVTAQSVKTGATEPSDGSLQDPNFAQVEGTAGDGPEWILSTQLLAASVMRAGDVNIIGLRRQTGGALTTTSAGFSSRVPVWGDYRLGPQLQVDRRQFVSDGSVLWLYAPSLRLTLQRPRLQVDVELGAELSRRDAVLSQQRTTRLFAYLGYRWLF